MACACIRIWRGFLCQSKLSFFRRTRLHWNSSRIFGGEKPMEAELYLSVCVIHTAKNLKDSVVSPSYPFLDRRDRIGILQEFLSGKNRWKQKYDSYRVELSLLISYSFPKIKRGSNSFRWHNINVAKSERIFPPHSDNLTRKAKPRLILDF